MAIDITTISVEMDTSSLRAGQRELDRTAQAGNRLSNSATEARRAYAGMATALTALSSAFGAGKIIQYADEWKSLTSQITQVTKSEKELITTRTKLIGLAEDTRTDLSATVQLYSNLSRATESLGISTKQTADITKTINNLFVAGGKGGAAAAAGITQLSQAFASGVLRGDEFNSVAENAPRILDALSAKLGKNRGELRAMAEQGALTAGILSDALLQYSATSQSLADMTARTFSQSMTQAKNNAVEFIGTSKSLNDAINSLGGGIESVSRHLNDLAAVAGLVALTFGVKMVKTLAAKTAAMIAASNATAAAALAEQNAALGAQRRAVAEQAVALSVMNRARAEGAGAAETLLYAESTAIANAANARLAASNATVAASATIAGRAMGAASAGMALLGGPLGAAMIAGAAVYYFATRANDAEKAIEKLNPSVDGLAERFKAMGEAGQKVVLKQSLIDLDEQRKKVDELTLSVEFLKKAKSSDAVRSFFGVGLDDQAFELEQAKEKLSDLQKQFNEMSPPSAEFNQWFKSLTDVNSMLGLVEKSGDGVLKKFSMFGNAPKVVSDSKTYKEMSAEIEKRIALFGKEGKAAELAYDIQTGKIKDLNKGEAKRLISLQKTEDSLLVSAELKKKEADLAKEAQESEESRAKTIADMVASMTREADLMGETSKEAQIRYDIEKDILKVKGGINGAEAQSLLKAAQANDIRREQLRAEEELNKKIQSDVEEQTQWAIDSVEAWSDEAQKQADEISQSLTDALMRGFESGKGFAQNLKDAFQNMFKTLIIKPVIQPIMDKAAGLIQGLMGGLSAGANMAIAGAAIVGSLWNDYMEKDIKELTSEFRQGRQSTGTLLGNANAKSDSISKALSEMGDNGASLLDVNHGMYQALLDIKTGISGSAAGFARQGLGGNAAAGIKTGVQTSGALNSLLGGSAIGLVGKVFGGEVGGFIDSVINSISKAIYNKKTSVIDSGIQIMGQTLADALDSGIVGAMNYAEVKTTKKFLGLTTSSKVKTQTSDLNEEFKIQFAQVFEGAGKALEEASKVFGATFDASKLMIDATKLSLKGLEGDALTKEIESFFSSTLDKWAGSLVEGLTQFQQVGEGAFETMVRLASQTNIFTSYAEKLLPKFNLVGLAAITATQSVAELSGGFDRLNTNMGSYYENFFSETEKSQRGLAQIGEALASVGLTMPKTREEFRLLVEGLDLSSEAQQKQYAALLDVNQAFAQFVPAAKAAESATNDLVNTFDAIAEQQKNLSDKLFEMTASDAEKRKRELDSLLSDENRAIQQQINNVIDLNKAKDAQAAIDSEAYALETQRLTLMGNTAALRERELALINPANQAKQKEIWALEDSKAAAEAAAQAQEAMAQAARDSAEEQKRLMQGVHDSISGALKSLMGESETLNAMTQSQARLTLQNALMTAKAGGSLVGFAGLDDALGAIQKQGTYSSSLESRLAMGRNIGLLSELSKYTKVDGSHANGLESVPYDGYIARLHKGERVQTAKEAQSTGDLAAKVDRLIEVVNAGNIAIAQNTAKGAKLLEKWDNDGIPEERSVA